MSPAASGLQALLKLQVGPCSMCCSLAALSLRLPALVTLVSPDQCYEALCHLLQQVFDSTVSREAVNFAWLLARHHSHSLCAAAIPTIDCKIGLGLSAVKCHQAGCVTCCIRAASTAAYCKHSLASCMHQLSTTLEMTGKADMTLGATHSFQAVMAGACRQGFSWKIHRPELWMHAGLLKSTMGYVAGIIRSEPTDAASAA